MNNLARTFAQQQDLIFWYHFSVAKNDTKKEKYHATAGKNASKRKSYFL